MKVTLAAIILVFSMAATACNTVEGLGKDTKAAGQAVENTANDNK